MIAHIAKLLDNRHVLVISRIVLGIIFVAAGVFIVPHQLEFAGVVTRCGILPDNQAQLFGLALPREESGLTSLGDNDLEPGIFQRDSDPTTTNHPTKADTYGKGLSDGEGDANRNGRYDSSETSPMAQDATGEFGTVTVDDTPNDVGQYTSIALDANNAPYISYYDATDKDLKYATKSSGIWAIEKIDDVGDVGKYTSIALDQVKNRYISYYDQSSEQLKLAYTESTAGPWQKTRGPDATLISSKFTSMVLHPMGINPIVAYFDNNDAGLKLAIYDRGGILPENIKDEQGWAVENVVTSNTYIDSVSLALDSGSEPHVSYIDLTGLHADLKYAEKQCLGSGCLTQVTLNQPTGQGTWNFETVDSSGTSGYFTSLALDSNNNPHISYYNATNTYLKYAVKGGTGWVIENVDTVGDVGKYNSIALDSNKNPHISYYDATNGDLKYATKGEGGWTLEVIDRQGDVGRYTSIALDSSNEPHISYYDVTNGNLKYASVLPQVLIDVWIKDCTRDNGTVPSRSRCPRELESPDIYIDNDNNNIIDLPNYGSTNTFKAKIRNKSAAAVTNVSVRFYRLDRAMRSISPNILASMLIGVPQFINIGPDSFAIVAVTDFLPPNPPGSEWLIGVVLSHDSDPAIQPFTDPLDDNNVAAASLTFIADREGQNALREWQWRYYWWYYLIFIVILIPLVYLLAHWYRKRFKRRHP